MRNFAQQRSVFNKEEDDKDKRNVSLPSTTTMTTSSPTTTSIYGDRNLYEEMKVMCELSALIYTVAYLLELVAQGGYPDPESSSSSSSSSWWWWRRSPPQLKQLEKTELVLANECTATTNSNNDDKDTAKQECPEKLKRNLAAGNVLEFINANEDALSQDREITGDVPENNVDSQVSPRSRLVASALRGIEKSQDDASLWHFDHHFGDKSLVYAITVNRLLKRVTIIFRGSSTRTDWYQNAQLTTSPLDKSTLLEDELGFPKEKQILVHSGFEKYLFDGNLKNKKMSMDEMKKLNREGHGKYSQILEDLEEIYTYKDPSSGQQIHEGFHLYVSGHSLGGALSQLLAMKLACSRTVKEIGSIPKPIINISVASPYVGDESFVQAVKLLEDHNWLRHIRVTNQGDVVPVSPPKNFLWGGLYRPYVHTGLNIHLVPPSSESTDNRIKQESRPNSEIGFNMVRTFSSQLSLSSSERHSASDYWLRQEADRTYLETTTIGQLYDEYSQSTDNEDITE